jgi:hypothetical protein
LRWVRKNPKVRFDRLTHSLRSQRLPADSAIIQSPAKRAASSVCLTNLAPGSNNPPWDRPQTLAEYDYRRHGGAVCHLLKGFLNPIQRKCRGRQRLGIELPGLD